MTYDNETRNPNTMKTATQFWIQEKAASGNFANSVGLPFGTSLDEAQKHVRDWQAAFPERTYKLALVLTIPVEALQQPANVHITADAAFVQPTGNLSPKERLAGQVWFDSVAVLLDGTPADLTHVKELIIKPL